jgi:hypothetical protein
MLRGDISKICTHTIISFAYFFAMFTVETCLYSLINDFVLVSLVVVIDVIEDDDDEDDDDDDDEDDAGGNETEEDAMFGFCSPQKMRKKVASWVYIGTRMKRNMPHQNIYKTSTFVQYHSQILPFKKYSSRIISFISNTMASLSSSSSMSASASSTPSLSSLLVRLTKKKTDTVEDETYERTVESVSMECIDKSTKIGSYCVHVGANSIHMFILVESETESKTESPRGYLKRWIIHTSKMDNVIQALPDVAVQCEHKRIGDTVSEHFPNLNRAYMMSPEVLVQVDEGRDNFYSIVVMDFSMDSMMKLTRLRSRVRNDDDVKNWSMGEFLLCCDGDGTMDEKKHNSYLVAYNGKHIIVWEYVAPKKEEKDKRTSFSCPVQETFHYEIVHDGDPQTYGLNMNLATLSESKHHVLFIGSNLCPCVLDVKTKIIRKIRFPPPPRIDDNLVFARDIPLDTYWLMLKSSPDDRHRGVVELHHVHSMNHVSRVIHEIVSEMEEAVLGYVWENSQLPQKSLIGNVLVSNCVTKLRTLYPTMKFNESKAKKDVEALLSSSSLDVLPYWKDPDSLPSWIDSHETHTKCYPSLKVIEEEPKKFDFRRSNWRGMEKVYTVWSVRYAVTNGITICSGKPIASMKEHDGIMDGALEIRFHRLSDMGSIHDEDLDFDIKEEKKRKTDVKWWHERILRYLVSDYLKKELFNKLRYVFLKSIESILSPVVCWDIHSVIKNDMCAKFMHVTDGQLHDEINYQRTLRRSYHQHRYDADPKSLGKLADDDRALLDPTHNVSKSMLLAPFTMCPAMNSKFLEESQKTLAAMRSIHQSPSEIQVDVAIECNMTALLHVTLDSGMRTKNSTCFEPLLLTLRNRCGLMTCRSDIVWSRSEVSPRTLCSEVSPRTLCSEVSPRFSRSSGSSSSSSKKGSTSSRIVAFVLDRRGDFSETRHMGNSFFTIIYVHDHYVLQ